MRTQVAVLYESAHVKYKLTVHGGQSGMSNSASWVYLAEDIHNVTFLKGGELVITTGLFTQNGITLYEFIRAFAMYNCSGILINVGQYLQLDDITPEILQFCNENRFPLFTMPWEIHLVDIMQEFCGLFVRENHREDHLSAAFQGAIYQTPVPDSILRVLNQYGFATSADYQLIAIRNLEDPTRITSPLNSYGLKYHLFQHDNLMVLIYHTAQKQISLDGIIEVICFYDGIMLGVSDTVHTLEEVGACYRRARFSLAAAEFWKRPFVKFDELGMFQLLFCVSDPNLLVTMYQRRLGKLEQYDLNHDSDYMNTLRIFLLSDCNLLDTASRMHTHRNTVVYRIRKIKELLNSEMDDATVKFDLLMAFYIKEYLAM
ncbi:MAG: putative transcriptional regulator [Oscillospiraceae bacterium]|nr:putative transcriptional regulator [Oscillospiraceae bacterium]